MPKSEARKKYEAEWRKANPEKCRAYWQKRWRKVQNSPELLEKNRARNKKWYYESGGAARMKEMYHSSWSSRAANLAANAKQRAKRKDIPHTLNCKKVLAIIEAQDYKCALTGIPFQLENPFPHCFKNPLGPSLDQIQPSCGYTEDNVRVVLSIVNDALGEYPDDFVKEVLLHLFIPYQED